jgi:hypothetical protein
MTAAVLIVILYNTYWRRVMSGAIYQGFVLAQCHCQLIHALGHYDGHCRGIDPTTITAQMTTMTTTGLLRTVTAASSSAALPSFANLIFVTSDMLYAFQGIGLVLPG